jgi:predicted HNH restriction endonuclease
MAKLEKRSYADRAEYLKKAVTERRRKLKRMLVEYKGGACVLCGYSGYFGAFDLHHTGDSPKAFGIAAGGFSRSWESLKREADKCVLLCANCHREVHGGVAHIDTRHLGKSKRMQ